MDIGYIKTATGSVEAVAQAVTDAALLRNFRTLHVHDVQATLSEKGFSIAPYRIVEVCNSGFAFKAITAERSVGMMLPCRIAVYDHDGVTTLALMKPSLIADMLPGADFGGVPAEVEEVLRAVVDEVAA
jgi:uncharacterized protein (DUF302 family)